MMNQKCKTCFWLKCQCDDCTNYSRWRDKNENTGTDEITCHRCGKKEKVKTKPWPNWIGYLQLLPDGWVSGIVDLNDCWCPQCNPRNRTPIPRLRELQEELADYKEGCESLKMTVRELRDERDALELKTCAPGLREAEGNDRCFVDWWTANKKELLERDWFHTLQLAWIAGHAKGVLKSALEAEKGEHGNTIT